MVVVVWVVCSLNKYMHTLLRAENGPAPPLHVFQIKIIESVVLVIINFLLKDT